MSLRGRESRILTRCYVCFRILIIILFIVVTCLIRDSRAGSNERRLLKELFTVGEYNKLERPVYKESDSLVVRFGLVLQQIIDVDEKNQIINTNLWLNMRWSDYSLIWNETEYGGIKSLRVPPNVIWKPDILMYNRPLFHLSTDLNWFSEYGCRSFHARVVSIHLLCSYHDQLLVKDISVWYRRQRYSEIPGNRDMEQYRALLAVLPLPVYRLQNADEDIDSTFPTNVIVSSNGDCLWVPPGLFLSTCTIDITWFPFDDQFCQMKFGSWTYDSSGIDLQLQSDAGDLSSFILNGEWQLIGMPAQRNVVTYDCCPERYIDVTFTVHIRRRTLFYGFNLIIPCVLISSTALLTFTLPPESGEKISLGVTILLSLTVFLLLVAEAMPPTSDALPLIGMYFAAIMLMCSLSVVFTVLVLNYHHRTPSTHVMPRWVKKIICEWLAWLVRMQRPGHDPPTSVSTPLLSHRKQRTLTVSTHPEIIGLTAKFSKSLLANVLSLDKSPLSNTNQNANGQCTLQNANGQCTLQNANGQCTLQNANWQCTLQNANGQCTLQNANGQCTLQNANGQCTLQNANGQCTLQNANGQCILQNANGQCTLQNASKDSDGFLVNKDCPDNCTSRDRVYPGKTNWKCPSRLSSDVERNARKESANSEKYSRYISSSINGYPGNTTCGINGHQRKISSDTEGHRSKTSSGTEGHSSNTSSSSDGHPGRRAPSDIEGHRSKTASGIEGHPRITSCDTEGYSNPNNHQFPASGRPNKDPAHTDSYLGQIHPSQDYPDTPQLPPFTHISRGLLPGRNYVPLDCWSGESRSNGSLRVSKDKVTETLGEILREVRCLAERVKDRDAEEGECDDWKFAAMVIDRLCLISFAIFTVASTFAILFSAPHVIT